MYFPTLFLIDISQVRLSELFIRFYDGQTNAKGGRAVRGTPQVQPPTLYPILSNGSFAEKTKFLLI